MEAVEVDDKGRLRPSPPASDSGHALTPEEVQDTPALSHGATEEGRQEEQEEEEEGEDGGFDPPRREITHMLASEDACSPSEEHSVNASLSLALNEHDDKSAVERASSSFTFVSPSSSFSAIAAVPAAATSAASPTSATTDLPEATILTMSPPSGALRASPEEGE